MNEYRSAYQAINIVYKSLQQDREKADISDIIRQFSRVIDDAIQTKHGQAAEGPLYDISQIDFERLRQEFQRSETKNTTVQCLKQAIEDRLRRLLAQNPLRTNFQWHYETIVANYNREKDQVTIEQTFETLLQLVNELDEEGRRAVREGLDEESLAIFDLLKKPNLSASEMKKIKTIAMDLLKKLKAEKLRVDHWQEKEGTRDAVKTAILDFLWSDETGLPAGCYSENDVQDRAEEVFRHVYRVYPTIPSPFYNDIAAA